MPETNNLIGDVVNPYQQTYADTCAIKSQQIILNDFGIPVTEDQLVQYSFDKGWYRGDGTGTLMTDVGNLLEVAGIPCTRQSDANVFNLVNELSQGHKIIVGVDADELWYDDTITGKFKNWYNDFFNGETPNHALIVTGIDTSDPDNIKVVVTDPGNGDHYKSYPLDQFMDAWADASCYMVSTDIAVPQSCPGMENFNTETGHIDEIAGVNYADFQIFNDMSYGLPSGYVYNDGMYLSPMSSLVNGYFDFANHDIMFPQLFDNQNYMFNDFLSPQIVADNIIPQMCETYNNGLNFIDFTSGNGWNDYAAFNDLSMCSNANYSEFLNQSISDFQVNGDLLSAMYCEQQQMMLDFCNQFGFDFYDTFMI